MTRHARRSHDGHTRAVRHIALSAACILWLFACVPDAAAEPITPSHQGCVSQLPDNRATWTSGRHFQFVAFWDPVSGCDPTIHQSIVLHEWLENFDGAGGLKIEALFNLFPKCGRIQFDAQSYVNATSNVLDALGLVSLVFDTKVDCASASRGEEPPGSKRDGTPDGTEDDPTGFASIWDSLPDPTPQLFDPEPVPGPQVYDFPNDSSDPEWPLDPPPPGLTEVAIPVPEPGAALLVATGLALLRARTRRRRRDTEQPGS